VTTSSSVDNPNLDKYSINIFPNPSSTKAEINYYLVEGSRINLEVFDLNGKVVKVLLHNQSQSSGEYHINIDLSELADGIYLVRLITGNSAKTSKLVVSKSSRN
jgi:hypothetical protein